jgi:hypothetical protein
VAVTAPKKSADAGKIPASAVTKRNVNQAAGAAAFLALIAFFFRFK